MGKHLSYKQRCQLDALHAAGQTQVEIASALGCSQSAISRELQRNRSPLGYACDKAQERSASRRRQAESAPRKATADLVRLIEAKLRREQLSPDQISGWLKATGQPSLSHEWIYRHIWADKAAGGDLHAHLRRHGKVYNKRANKLVGRGIIPDRVDIDQRPAIVAQRGRIGDWEADTMVGRGRKGAILSLVERVTKYTILQRLDGATAQATARAMIQKLKPLRHKVQTITADNGKEFAEHRTIARQLGAEFYFAKPYHAWERGLNENTNGLVRQYFPKGTSFVNLSDQQVMHVQRLLNSRPRKTLGYKSPNEVFNAP
jgi:transposase, IS30 family